jgi:hypothetical protein
LASLRATAGQTESDTQRASGQGGAQSPARPEVIAVRKTKQLEEKSLLILFVKNPFGTLLFVKKRENILFVKNLVQTIRSTLS